MKVEEQPRLFVPLIFLVMGMLIVIQARIEATDKRVDALIEWLKEKGIFS